MSPTWLWTLTPRSRGTAWPPHHPHPLLQLLLTKPESPFTDTLRAISTVKPSQSPEDRRYPPTSTFAPFSGLTGTPCQDVSHPYRLLNYFTSPLTSRLWSSAHTVTGSKYSSAEWSGLAPTLFLGHSLTECLKNLFPHLSRCRVYTSWSVPGCVHNFRLAQDRSHIN